MRGYLIVAVTLLIIVGSVTGRFIMDGRIRGECLAYGYEDGHAGVPLFFSSPVCITTTIVPLETLREHFRSVLAEPR